MQSNELLAFQKEAEAEGRECVVSGLIRDPQGRIFVQKRAPTRALFPGAWDIAGGHVDPGESIYEALGREIFEETGWKLGRILELVGLYDWETESGGRTRKKREFDFLVEVEGDLDRPQLEADKFTEFLWASEAELEILKRNRLPADIFIYELVKRALNGQRWERGAPEQLGKL